MQTKKLIELGNQVVNYHLERTGATYFCNSIGFFLYRVDGSYLYCDEFYIKPEYRRSKHASELFNLMLTIGKSKGCSEFVSWVDLRSKNPSVVHRALLKEGAVMVDSGDPERPEYRKTI